MHGMFDTHLKWIDDHNNIIRYINVCLSIDGDEKTVEILKPTIIAVSNAMGNVAEDIKK